MSDQFPASVRERALQMLQTGSTLAGFTVRDHQRVDELDADAFVLSHAVSGARLLYLACEDENKAFAIGFKTPPADDTGVFHILEHSVLCGSERYPVKEPFVDLIKSSMQTFLNAMTYPDKTVYPVASTNEQDLMNLASVYMDAVLNPAIYTKRSIFEQEGWHYELDVPEDGALANGQLRYNGVVFNEMKGALSDPTDVLDNAVMRALFPDTAYAFESGGNPRAIPHLTYEQFLDTHARHYNLANSYITLYGILDIERFLTFLDTEFLSRENAASRAGAGPANPLVSQQPVACDYQRVSMRTTPENALVGMAYVLGGALDRKRVIAADILFDALLGSNEAPVKKALMQAGVGGNVSNYSTSGSCLQPYELIMVQNAQPEAAERVRRVIEDTCRDLVATGIPRDRLEAVLSSVEYDLRQRDYGVADGVAIACDALGTWLYSDDAATLALQYGPVYAELRRELAGTYFEDLLREVVLESEHYALVELVPEPDTASAAASEADGGAAGSPQTSAAAPTSTESAAGRAEAGTETDDTGTPAEPADAAASDAGEAAELAAYQASCSEADLQAIVDAEAALRAQQEAEDAPEATATLPRLHVADIGPARPEPALTVDTTTPLPCLKHDIPTHRLAYALYYFDLSHLSYAELPYARLLSVFMQQLATDRRSTAELDSYIGSNLGFLSFQCEVIAQPDWRLARPMLTVAAGALSEKLPFAASIPQEVWARTRFEDTERMRDVLTQMRIGMEQSFLNAGHAAALGRAHSYSSPAAVVSQQLAGVDFYRFLRELIEHFDERKNELCRTLRELQQRVFTSTGTYVSFTGSDEDYRRFWECAGNLGLTPRTAAAKELYVPMPEARREAFIIPSDVCFAARSIDPRRLDIATDGTWSVVSQVLSYDYLWNEIRVKGGAYGCGFRATIDRQLAFYTYRDPAIDPSLARIDRAGSWLTSFDPDQEAFEGFIVSCAAGFDTPLKPYALTKRQNNEFFAKRPAGWRQHLREQLLATTPEQVRALGATISRVAAEAPLCVFGGREIIEASHADLVPVDLLA